MNIPLNQKNKLKNEFVKQTRQQFDYLSAELAQAYQNVNKTEAEAEIAEALKAARNKGDG